MKLAILYYLSLLNLEKYQNIYSSHLYSQSEQSVNEAHQQNKNIDLILSSEVLNIRKEEKSISVTRYETILSTIRKKIEDIKTKIKTIIVVEITSGFDGHVIFSASCLTSL